MNNDDAISRKSVIDVLIRNRVHFCDMVRITSELKELPSVTPKVEECEDAISRQAVLDMKYTVEVEDMWHMAQEVEVVSVSDIKALPSVTPQPKMGRWIKVTNGRGGHECDMCHVYAPSYTDGDEYLSAFCPSCGVKMKGSEESNADSN